MPVYANDGSATASRAARSENVGASTRRASRYAGIAASDMKTAFIVFTAAYASGSESKSAYAGLIRIG